MFEPLKFYCNSVYNSFFFILDQTMFAKQDVLTLAFVTLNLILLYYILLEVYLYLILMVAGYLGHRFMRKSVIDNLDMRGKCVLITGCDTVKY